MKPDRQWPFFRKAANSNSPKSELQSQAESPSAKWYRRINDLPLRNFIDATINGNLSALIISGYPTEQQLAEACQEIQFQFHDALGNEAYKQYVNQLRAITDLRVTYNQIQICVKQLCDILEGGVKTSEIEDIEKYYQYELNRLLKVNFVFDKNNRDAYLQTLNRCLNRSKGIKIDLDIKVQNFEAIEKAHETAEPIDGSYFQAMLITLSDAAGYHLSDGITVLEFCERIKRLNSKKTKPR